MDDVGQGDEMGPLRRWVGVGGIHVEVVGKVEEDSLGEVRPEGPGEHHVVKRGGVLRGLGDEGAVDSMEVYVRLGGNL